MPKEDRSSDPSQGHTANRRDGRSACITRPRRSKGGLVQNCRTAERVRSRFSLTASGRDRSGVDEPRHTCADPVRIRSDQCS
jgi:hypothetical protein